MDYWLFPWAWEENSNATNLLGFPVASDFSTSLMETQIHGKLQSSIAKLQRRQLTLAGRVVAANCLILGTIWYLVTLWAWDLSFLSGLQKIVEAFVWSGRSRENRNTATQSKAQGGLGVILIIEQYNAIAGNLMLWVRGTEGHPLRTILCSYLRDLSQRQGGFPDFSWVTSKGGSKRAPVDHRYGKISALPGTVSSPC